MTGYEIYEYTRQLLVALAHLHSKRVVHQDIKPDNYLYDHVRKQCVLQLLYAKNCFFVCRYLLTDFGLAAILPECAPGLKRTDSFAESEDDDVGANVRLSNYHLNNEIFADSLN